MKSNSVCFAGHQRCHYNVFKPFMTLARRRCGAPFPKCAGRGGWQCWISCGFVAWPGLSLADHAADKDGAKGHPRVAKHIPFRKLAHFGAFLTLPLPSRDVHKAAVTLSQPSFILEVTVMATNPTLPSVGAFRGLEEFFWRGQKFLGSF